MNRTNLAVDIDRLMGRIRALGEVGALPGGGVCRLALSEEDRGGRDLVCRWMRELGLELRVDAIGNIFGLRRGREDGPPVMTGSHIDTVRTGGLYDGALGVLAGLEIVELLNRAGIETRYPLMVAAFTNEEGARFPPDMMGSLVHVGDLSLEEALATEGIDGETVGSCLRRIGYAGEAPVGRPEARAFVELHVEQGPVLEREGVTIGAVEGVQGISWQAVALEGVSNHAGTTPISMRRDPGLVAAEIAVFSRRLALELGGDQVASVGFLRFVPDLVNVVPGRAELTLDLRSTDGARLREAERRLAAFVEEAATREGVEASFRRLARFAPAAFDPATVARVEGAARRLGHPVRRMPSGAGHDAQIMARVCPTAMIFVPSAGGTSHNIEEYTAPEDIAAGADVLLQVLLELLEGAQQRSVR